ncbi:MAG: hypothetical protein JXR40_02730 [Pontiellaceae bacterium]|nr:hypothetical protein [Pontiellaceae bacterium]
MKNTKLGKIAFVAGAVVFSALVGAKAADVNQRDAVDMMAELNGTASTAAVQMKNATDPKSLEEAKLVQAVVKYEIAQGAAAVDRLQDALDDDNQAAAKKAMKDLKAALDAAKNALKKNWPKNLKDLVDRAQIVIPAGVSQQTINNAYNAIDVSGVGPVNPNDTLTDSKKVQGAKAQEAAIGAAATGRPLPNVNPGNKPGTGV